MTRTFRKAWDSGEVEVDGVTWATKDADGTDLIYPGPDGFAYWRGELVYAEDYPGIQAWQEAYRARIHSLPNGRWP